MQSAEIPLTEQLRLKALRAYDILDTDAEVDFDKLTRLAAQICGTSIALISFVDEDRQWFKSAHSLDTPETPREQAFCAHAILEHDAIFSVPDARADARFKDNPLVALRTSAPTQATRSCRKRERRSGPCACSIGNRAC